MSLSKVGEKKSKLFDSVFTSKGTVGRIAYVGEQTQEFVYSPQLCYWRSLDFDAIDPRFLNYWMNGNEFKNQVDYLKGQTDMADYVSLRDQRNMTITVPDINLQRNVAKVLGSIDDKIELNRQINQTLEQIAQAIFKSWFVDFEPVKAKIRANEEWRMKNGELKGNNSKLSIQHSQFINRAAVRAISGMTEEELSQTPPDQLAQLQTIAALFPEELVDSKLGLIPKGWEWSTIGKEVDVVGGGTPSTKNPDFWEDGTYNWTTPKDLSGNPDKILLSTGKKLTEAGLGKISSGLLPVDTVLLSSRAPVGYLALAKVPVAVNQGYIAMKCHKVLPPVYVLQWAESVMDDIKQRASGTTFAEISKKNFRIIPVLVPAGDILGRFQQIVGTSYEKIKESISESVSLAETRDTLLPKLLSGEIELSDAENE